jgi:T5SS/PEP-CTERM-associated repeat protein
MPWVRALFAGITLCAAANLPAAINGWTNSSSGLWRVGAGNWSANVAPSNSSLSDPTQIANAGSKTVMIDPVTTSTNLAIRGLVITAPTGATNVLALDNVSGAPLSTSKAFLVGIRASLCITNSAVSPASTFDVSNGVVVLDSGSLTCPVSCDLQSGTLLMNSGTLTVGNLSTGLRMGRFSTANAALLLNGGIITTPRLVLGSVAGSQNSAIIAGGTLICTDAFSAGQMPSTTANLTLSSGDLIVTNGVAKIADRAAATFNQSGGNASFVYLSVGDVGFGTYNLSNGTLTMVPPRTTNDFLIIGNLENANFNQSGGQAIIHSELHVSDSAGVIGNLNITGGQLFATNDLVAIGRQGIGSMIVSNSLVVLTNTSVGRHSGATGTLRVQDGGELFFTGDLSIGRFAGASGEAFVEGGLLLITNDDLWVGRGGQGNLTVSIGALSARSLHVGNSDDGTNAPTGNFTVTGGDVLVSSNFTVGTQLLSTGHVAIASGTLSVTNLFGTAALEVQAGDFSVNGGTITVDALRVTNTSGNVSFNSGTLLAKGITAANGQPFVVGDGTNPATLELQGGTYNFADGLVISANATVTGCGTVIGNVINNGTYNNPCIVPNIAITSLTKTGNVASISFTSLNGLGHTLEFKVQLTDATWTPILPGIVGDGNTMTLSDVTSTNAARFYRIHAQ